MNDVGSRGSSWHIPSSLLNQRQAIELRPEIRTINPEQPRSFLFLSEPLPDDDADDVKAEIAATIATALLMLIDQRSETGTRRKAASFCLWRPERLAVRLLRNPPSGSISIALLELSVVKQREALTSLYPIGLPCDGKKQRCNQSACRKLVQAVMQPSRACRSTHAHTHTHSLSRSRLMAVSGLVMTSPTSSNGDELDPQAPASVSMGPGVFIPGRRPCQLQLFLFLLTC